MKLDSEVQKAMDDAGGPREDGEFAPLDDGFYLARIESIELSKKAGPSGYKQWVVVWRIEAPKAARKRTQWERYSLSPAAGWKMRQLFDALGYSYDSDSAELVGERAILELFQAPIQSGDRKGEISNEVEKVYAEDDESVSKLVGD